MHRRTARGNRAGLALTGLLLSAAGVVLLLARQGRIGSARRRDVLYPAQARRFVHAHESWLWPVVAAVAIVLGLIFLRWLLVQLRVDRLRSVVVDTEQPGADAPAGRTRVPAHAVTDVVEDDIAALRGVRRVSATMSGHGDAPQLWLSVTTDSEADVGGVRRAITTDVLTDVRACLELPDLPTYLQLNVSRRTGDGATRPPSPSAPTTIEKDSRS